MRIETSFRTLSLMRPILSLCFAAALLGFAVPARAGLTAAELAQDNAVLNEFNAVVFGNYQMGNEDEGRVAVGGNLAGGSHNICFNGCSGSTTDSALGGTYGALTVWGNVSGGANPIGNAAIQGSIEAGATLNFNGNGGLGIVGSNGGTVQGATFVDTSQSSAGTVQNAPSGATTGLNMPAGVVFPYAGAMPFAAPLTDLATSLQADAAATNAQTLGAYVQNGPTGITAAAANGNYNGMHYGFITTTMADLAGYQNFSGVNTNGLDAVFVIVTGQSTSALPNLNPTYNETNVVWDFVDATTVGFAGGWYGQILAPYASVSNPSGNLTGAVVAAALTQSNELHQQNYLFPGNDLSGLPVTPTTQGDGTPVPEPTAGALLAAGLAGLALARAPLPRRRRRGRTAACPPNPSASASLAPAISGAFTR